MVKTLAGTLLYEPLKFSLLRLEDVDGVVDDITGAYPLAPASRMVAPYQRGFQCAQLYERVGGLVHSLIYKSVFQSVVCSFWRCRSGKYCSTRKLSAS